MPPGPPVPQDRTHPVNPVTAATVFVRNQAPQCCGVVQPKAVEHRSLTTLREKLFQLAEVAVPRAPRVGSQPGGRGDQA
jgi:hypothetical protein